MSCEMSIISSNKHVQKNLFSVAHEWSKEEDGVKKLLIKPYSTALKWIHWSHPELKKNLKVQKDALSHVNTIFSWTELPDEVSNLKEKIIQLKKSIVNCSLWDTIVYTSKVSEYGFAMSDFLGSFNPIAPTTKTYFSYNYANPLSLFGLFENSSYLITTIHRFILEYKHLIFLQKNDPKYTLAWIRIVKKIPTLFLSVGGIFLFFLGVCYIPKVLYLLLCTGQVIMQISCHFFKELHLNKSQ